MMPENSTNQPMVSIIVPVYKAERFLDECIRSITDQTYSSLEIILGLSLFGVGGSVRW